MLVTTEFLIAAAAMVLISLLFLLWPMFRRKTAIAEPGHDDNAGVIRQQLAELEQDKLRGLLGGAEFEQAKTELCRRLLEESGDPIEPAPTAKGMPWRTAVVLLTLVPLAAAVAYLLLGKPESMGHAPEVGRVEIEKMVDGLAARLAKNPDDLQGWAMLARSYKALQRMDDAEKAFLHLGEALYADPSNLASYADLLAQKAGGNLEGKPLELVKKALTLDPDHQMALSLAGTAAYERKDFSAALRYWERLLKTLPEDSEDARSVIATLNEIRSEAGVAMPSPARKNAAATAKAGAPAGSVSGRAEIAKNLAAQLKPEDTVFVFARPPSGGMPVAIRRYRGADLPFDFTLDDSNGMAGVTLSTAGTVVIEVRVSHSGNAKAAPGDLFGKSAPVSVGAKGLKIRIDQQVQ